MSYRTSAFSRLPFEVSTSDAPSQVDLEIRFRSFNGEVIPADESQHVRASAHVSIRTKEAARGLVEELRAAANSIEKFIPNITA